MQATSLRKGTTILFRDELYVVTSVNHRTPGNLRAFVQVSMKSLISGKSIQNRFSSTETVEPARMDGRGCQFLYHDGEGYHFMDMQSYDNFALREDIIGDGKYYLKENMELVIHFYDGKPVYPEYPKIIIMKLTESPPWVRGDSVSNNLKPAVTETGLKIQVPIFLDEGAEIKVNTDSGEYVGRAN